VATIYTDNFKISDIDTVLFDKDGTFLNADLYWGKVVEERISKIIEHFNLDKTLFKELCLEMGYDRGREELTINGPVSVLSREGVIKEIIISLEKYNVQTNFKTMSEIFNDVHSSFICDINQYTKIINGAVECLKLMKEHNFKLAVVTSDTHTHTVEILKHLNLEKYFDVIVGKEDTINEKKTGEPALLALKLLNSNPENTIVIGDAPMDYLMAKNSNIKDAILVTTGKVPIRELKSYTSKIIDNLKKIKIK